VGKLIGITGLAGSGKSTVAEYLELFGGFKRVSFATPVKEMAATLLTVGYCYDRDDVDWYLAYKEVVLPKLGVSMRHLLQTLGTDWGRNMISQSIWTNSVMHRVLPRQGEPSNVVIDDVCFEDEAAFIRSNGGMMIHLIRPGVEQGGHISESGVSVGANDVVINNSGSIAELLEEIDRAIETLNTDHDQLLAMCLTPCIGYAA